MSDVLKSVRLDDHIMRTYYKVFIYIYAIGVFLSVMTKVPSLTVLIAVVISAPILGLYFSVYERNNLSKLYGILPIRKSDVVIGRYVFALLIVVTNGIIASAITYVLSSLLHAGDRLTYMAVVSASFLYFCLFLAVLLPVYFKYPFAKVYVLANLPYYVLAVLGGFVVRRTAFLKHVSQALQYFASHQAMILISAVGLGLVLLALSCSLSCLIYRRAEL